MHGTTNGGRRAYQGEVAGGLSHTEWLWFEITNSKESEEEPVDVLSITPFKKNHPARCVFCNTYKAVYAAAKNHGDIGNYVTCIG